MSDLICCVRLVDRALGPRCRTFVGPNEEQFVWKSKNNLLEVRTRFCFPSPFEIKGSLTPSAVVRQNRVQTHCRVGFARTFIGRP